MGNDPEKWQTNIPAYREVVYEEVYPHIDLRLYGKQGSLRYDFIVEPGGDVNDIRLAYTGVDQIAIEKGKLVISTSYGRLTQSPPYLYQEVMDKRVEVGGGFKLIGDKTYGFEVRMGILKGQSPLGGGLGGTFQSSPNIRGFLQLSTSSPSPDSGGPQEVLTI